MLSPLSSAFLLPGPANDKGEAFVGPLERLVGLLEAHLTDVAIAFHDQTFDDFHSLRDSSID